MRINKVIRLAVIISVMIFSALLSVSCGDTAISNEEENTSSEEPLNETKQEDTITAEKQPYEVEQFELSSQNDYSMMYSRDERIFAVYAYPSGITSEDFSIESNWEEYIKIPDVNVRDLEDKAEITFKVSIDPAILNHSSSAASMIEIVSNEGKIRSDSITFPVESVEISDAEPLTLNIGEPQIATFKVVPASLPLDELKIGMNANVQNLEAEIIDSEKDPDNNCQYVHVEITASGRHNGMTTGYINLNDINQFRGGQCDLTINE